MLTLGNKLAKVAKVLVAVSKGWTIVAQKLNSTTLEAKATPLLVAMVSNFVVMLIAKFLISFHQGRTELDPSSAKQTLKSSVIKHEGLCDGDSLGTTEGTCDGDWLIEGDALDTLGLCVGDLVLNKHTKAHNSLSGLDNENHYINQRFEQLTAGW